MGEIEEELGFSLQLQYSLHRAYKEFFPGLELDRGHWSYTKPAEKPEEIQPVPRTSQDVLSAESG